MAASQNNMADIVLVEDEEVLRRYLTSTLQRLEHTVRAAETAEDGLRAIEQGEPDLLLTDQRLPGMSGYDLLLRVKAEHPGVGVVILTAHGSIEDAVEAMRAGASDYLRKPVNRGELEFVINRYVAGAGLRNELEYYRKKDLVAAPTDGIVGDAPSMVALREMVARLASHEKRGGGGPTVLLTGETGTGKGLVARALHGAAPRADAPFIEVNCAALPDHLLEAELMGYERGAFTGATQAKPGLFEAAETGTIFLDEIGRMSMALQAKLLKVIDERRLRRLGSTRDREMRCSIITATHLDIEVAVRDGEFLEDLFHRINVFRIAVPPLRSRGDDILRLAEHFLAWHAAEYGLPVRSLSDEARQSLCGYAWPGNVRELSHAMERAVVLGGGETVGVGDLAYAFADPALASTQKAAASTVLTGSRPLEVDFSEGPVVIEDFERALIQQAYDQAGGNRSQAAKMLGLSKDTLRYRLEKFGIG
ncbi:MAG: two-component system response regulator AtoC [Hyphomicrobiaceae bacterium]|jgi:two-component system response regulator AtoC